MYMTKVDLVALCRSDTLHAFDIKFKNCLGHISRVVNLGTTTKLC